MRRHSCVATKGVAAQVTAPSEIRAVNGAAAAFLPPKQIPGHHFPGRPAYFRRLFTWAMTA